VRCSLAAWNSAVDYAQGACDTSVVTLRCTLAYRPA
jgi:hypothetical protein